MVALNSDQAIAKIRKCLALSRSANEHEAAAALRQAQALMRQHGLSEDDARLSDVAEQVSRPRAPAINRWEAILASLIDDAFGTQHFNQHRVRLLGLSVKRWREVVFIGVGAAPQVAAFAFDVLFRQCAKDRLMHIRRQPKACKPATLTARGDQFAIGWVLAVRQLVERYAGSSGDQLLIEQYKAAHYPDLSTVKPRDTRVGRNVRDADLEAGFSAGKAARLDKGLPGAADTPLLTRGSA